MSIDAMPLEALLKWGEDMKPVVARVNELEAENQRLREEAEAMRARCEAIARDIEGKCLDGTIGNAGRLSDREALAGGARLCADAIAALGVQSVSKAENASNINE